MTKDWRCVYIAMKCNPDVVGGVDVNLKNEVGA